MSTQIDQRTPLQKELDEAFKRYVLSGIALLEEKYGPDWVEMGQEAWEELFDIRDARSCVLGGIGTSLPGRPDYGELVETLGLNDDEEEGDAQEAFRYGFTSPPTPVTRSLIDPSLRAELTESDEWDALDRLWLKAHRLVAMRKRGVAVRDRYSR